MPVLPPVSQREGGGGIDRSFQGAGRRQGKASFSCSPPVRALSQAPSCQDGLDSHGSGGVFWTLVMGENPQKVDSGEKGMKIPTERPI